MNLIIKEDRLMTADGIEDPDHIKAALKQGTGCKETAGQNLLTELSNVMMEDTLEKKFNKASSYLSGFEPKTQVEATLFANYITLREQALLNFRNANDAPTHELSIKYSSLAAKLLNAANSVIQTLCNLRKQPLVNNGIISQINVQG